MSVNPATAWSEDTRDTLRAVVDDDLTPSELEFAEALDAYVDEISAAWVMLARYGIYPRPDDTLADGIRALADQIHDNDAPVAQQLALFGAGTAGGGVKS